MAWLVKTDRNGTKYYADNKCRKCGGQGYIHGYEHVFGGQCFDCGGTGMTKTYTWKEYTPEYAAKLADRRRRKAISQAPETNRRFFEKIGFDEDGRAWVVIGDAYAIKDDLKASGARYSYTVGWHFDRADNGYNCFEISVADIAEKNDLECWQLKCEWEIIEFIKARQAENAPKTASEYVGNIGETITATVTLTGVHKYQTHFTYYGETNYIYTFADDKGNTLVWKTASFQEIEEGKTYEIKGKVKEHSEYKGDKQTVLTRCKIK